MIQLRAQKSNFLGLYRVIPLNTAVYKSKRLSE